MIYLLASFAAKAADEKQDRKLAGVLHFCLGEKSSNFWKQETRELIELITPKTS